MTMKQQAALLWSDLKAWATKNPAIVCICLSVLAVFVIGYWAGAAR